MSIWAMHACLAHKIQNSHTIIYLGYLSSNNYSFNGHMNTNSIHDLNKKSQKVADPEKIINRGAPENNMIQLKEGGVIAFLHIIRAERRAAGIYLPVRLWKMSHNFAECRTTFGPNAPGQSHSLFDEMRPLCHIFSVVCPYEPTNVLSKNVYGLVDPFLIIQ